MNISYTKQGDYLLPNLKLEDKKRFNIGKYGLLKLDYLKRNNKGLYTKLLTENKLDEYIHNIDTTLIEMEQKLIEELAEKENITEELKSKNGVEWFKSMNNIKFRVQEIILKEYIYV